MNPEDERQKIVDRLIKHWIEDPEFMKRLAWSLYMQPRKMKILGPEGITREDLDDK